MAERAVRAEVVGLRYDCEECGLEVARDGDSVLTSMPLQYPHACPNGHTVNLTRVYPTYDFHITQEPL